eukprot:COSAG01_NODE_35245_length_534_cov_21.347126_1_plen_37_part_10
MGSKINIDSKRRGHPRPRTGDAPLADLIEPARVVRPL